MKQKNQDRKVVKIPTGTRLSNGGTNFPGLPEKVGDLGVFRSPYSHSSILVDVAERDRYDQLRWVALNLSDPRYEVAIREALALENNDAVQPKVRKVRNVRFFEIKWDTDGEKVDLPSDVTLIVDDPEMDIALEGADLLSDKYGWCVENFQFEELPEAGKVSLKDKQVQLEELGYVFSADFKHPDKFTWESIEHGDAQQAFDSVEQMIETAWAQHNEQGKLVYRPGHRITVELHDKTVEGEVIADINANNEVMVRVDGKTYQFHESQVMSYDGSEVGKVAAGQSLRDLYHLWDQLRDVPVTEDGMYLDQDFLHFTKGTEKEDVWLWFEAQNPRFVVGEVLQGIRQQDEAGKVVEQGAFQKVLMYASFEVGALSRDELENLAADFDIAVNDTLSSDYLRAEVLAKLESQGEPCTQVEYDDNFWGGDYSGVGNHAYVPDALIAAFDGDVDLAFGKLTHKDPIHIVTHTGDQTFSASGQPFVGYDLIVNAQQAANKPQVVDKDMKAKKPKSPSPGM